MTDKTKSEKNSRRSFLKSASVTAGVVAAGGLAAIPISKSPLDEDYPEVAENKVELPSNGKSVVVIGGGLAGLQAGVELSSRGFKVTVLEKTGTPGGKLKTWRDKTFGPDDAPAKSDPNFPGYIREHGIHAIWGFYNNLREFINRHDWGLKLLPQEMTPYVFIDKEGSISEIKSPPDVPAPYDRFLQAFNGSQINLASKRDQLGAGTMMRKLLSFDMTNKKQRDYMDSITFEEFCKRNDVPDSVTYKMMDAFLEMAFFDNVQNASALSLANIFQLVAGSADDMRIDLYQSPPGETFLEPMAEFIRQRGGEVIYNTELTDLKMSGEKLSSVTAAMADSQGSITRCSICGALLGANGQEFTKCPVCGANGDMIRLLDSNETTTRHFEADYFVSAMDVPASQAFYGPNIEKLGDQEYFKKIQKLNAVHVYVVNMWFEGQDFWKKGVHQNDNTESPVFFPTGFKNLGITINWTVKTKTDKDREFYLRDGSLVGDNVSIIETQIADAQELDGLSDEEIVEACYKELQAVMPDIPPQKSFYVNRWRHYTAYRVGDNANRPDVQSPIDNLLFIGDMAFVPHPAVFMEKTNVTAKWATNILLDKIGQKEGKIKILSSGTPTPWSYLLKRFSTLDA